MYTLVVTKWFCVFLGKVKEAGIRVIVYNVHSVNCAGFIEPRTPQIVPTEPRMQYIVILLSFTVDTPEVPKMSWILYYCPKSLKTENSHGMPVVCIQKLFPSAQHVQLLNMFCNCKILLEKQYSCFYTFISPNILWALWHCSFQGQADPSSLPTLWTITLYASLLLNPGVLCQ